MEGEVRFGEIKLSKGFQFTLPAIIRKKHNLRPGQTLEIVDVGDEIVLRPRRVRKITDLVGRFKAGKKFSVEKELDHVVSGV